MPEEPVAPAPIDEEKRLRQRLDLAKAQKDKGNEFFKKQEFQQAAEYYSKAHRLAGTIKISAELTNQDVIDSVRQVTLACLTNKALALSRLEDHEAVVKTCSEALELDPKNEKAMYRRATSQKELGRFQEAAADLQACLAINPTSSDAKKALKGLNNRKNDTANSHGGFNGIFTRPPHAGRLAASPPQPVAPAVPVPFAGLKNEGATCYLNSVLQTLYHLPALRKVIFAIPSSPVPPGEMPSLAVALQRLFFRLQQPPDQGADGRGQMRGLRREAVSVTELIASFGWDSDDTLSQQDVGEFVSVFLDNIEELIKAENLPPDISRLCGIEYRYTDRIHNPSSEASKAWIRTRDEPPHWPCTIHHIKECDGIMAALKSMCSSEIIDDFNTSGDFLELKKDLKKAQEKGDRDEIQEIEEKLAGMKLEGKEGFGKQNIQRSLRFKRLPPILFFNLQRLQYCPMRGVPVKINSRFAFEDKLDLTELMVDDPDQEVPPDPTGPPVYSLHSVIVHSGYSNMGHYVAYIRASGPPGEKGAKWYKFDDDHVSIVTEEEAIEESFGGEAAGWSRMLGGGMGMRLRSAYMLVYVKDGYSAATHNSADEQVPEHVRS
eukprot:CAMPEP_0177696218 /NCGR_PEP_ID=MMETSP0484_2-20121128/3864_1 /TAXON_ID=354590 /ORGANISM="Rhodomonas lens, Strain RHODO" /LENGTH=604 /DNA_ID=CAMNT_0019207177 /DNA_START=101 /DNA_END=1912 /DNA_ORIENTATION=-